MKKLLVIAFLALASSHAAWAQDVATVDTTAALADAKVAVLAWLHQIDEGEYRASWDSAGVAFKAAVTADQWESALMQARAPYALLKDRKLVSATYAKDLPNAPAGEYVVHVFTSKSGSATLTETVTVTRDPDGAWRAGGYFIRPS